MVIHDEGSSMFKRTKRVVVGVVALAALGAGGAVFAQAQSSSPSPPEHVSAPDRDTIQSGDQTTPDRPAAATAARKVHHSRGKHHPSPRHHTRLARAASVDTGSAQNGDQTTPDQPGVSERPGAENPEQSGEKSSESATNSDGPGGHADEPGNANADHQFQGAE